MRPVVLWLVADEGCPALPGEAALLPDPTGDPVIPEPAQPGPGSGERERGDDTLPRKTGVGCQAGTP